MAYCTNTQIKTALNITVADYDSQLTTLAATVSSRIDQLYNLPDAGFAVSADATRKYGPDDTCDGVLLLDAPLLTVTSITNGDGAVLASGQYRLLPLNAQRSWSIVPLSGYLWQWVPDGLISVVGKWGWSTTAPATVVEACTMYAGWLFKRYQGALQDATANQDLGQLVYGEAIPKQVLALLPPKNGKAIL